MKLLDYHRLHNDELKSWDRARIAEQALADDPEFVGEVASLLPPSERVRWSSPPPLVRDEAFQRTARLCELYRQGSAEQRIYIRSRVDGGVAGKLEGFGLRAAVFAAREHSLELIRASLTAFAIADLTGSDVRDTLICMALVFHCAKLAGDNAGALFQEVAAISGPAMNALFLNVAEHPSGLGAMGWTQVETPNGIGFRSSGGARLDT